MSAFQGELGTTLLPMIQTWAEIKADFGLNWFIYLSMPLIAAFVGYSTKLAALWMLYYPVERRGVGLLSWQGIVPRRAGKLATLTIQSLTHKLLDPQELLDKVDAKEAVESFREPLTRTVDDMARELAEQVRPGLWDSLPDAGRRAVHARVRAAAPRVVDNLLAEMKRDLPLYLDLQHLAVTTLVKNKSQLNTLMQGMGGGAQRFVRRSGIWFGLVIGLVQMVAWGLFQNPWIMPAFGFFTGFASDWLALNMLFVPRQPRRILGLFRFQGVIHGLRDEVTQNYARVMAHDIFSPDVLLEAILSGPSSDRLFAKISREVSRAIDEEAGVARPVVTLAVGTARYRTFKQQVIDSLMTRLPDTIEEARAKAVDFDAEQLIAEKMRALTNEEFESVMRPIFKDDEMLMVIVGAVLGFLVGELQVVMVEHLTVH